MKCPRCRHDNPPQSSFCLECGESLTLTCGSCGADLPSGSRFCNKCGTRVQIRVGLNSGEMDMRFWLERAEEELRGPV